VGGAVRDALLDHHKEYLDLDFVVAPPADAIQTAKRIAQSYHGGFVVLDEARRIARVVFPQGTVDFAQMEGEDPEQDLGRRDFTVNAIAYDPAEKTLIDPLEGLRDLEQKTLKMVSQSNLVADPLRLLRAYRQAAQLDFAISPETRTTIRKLAPLLAKVAAERVQAELNYLLKTYRGLPWLAQAWQDGLLLPWLESLNAAKLDRAAQVDKTAQLLHERIPSWSSSREELKIAKLICLVSELPKEAERELIHLKYSRQELRASTAVLKILPDLLKAGEFMSLEEQYFIFIKAGKFLPILLLIAAISEVNLDLIVTLGKHYFNPEDPVAHPQLFVTGHDLLKELNLTPSPKIGKLLEALALAQVTGKVTNFPEAIDLARQLYVDF
jgi:tRNA nucleotidyltransferase (CCA-adding enzyme)